MKPILIACEESQRVTIALRKRGIDAYSCDLDDCSGEHPEWHLKQDVVPLLKEDWSIIIAFPPCTYLSVSGNGWLKDQPKKGKGLVGFERRVAQQEAIEFFMKFVNCGRPTLIENPIGVMSSKYRKPDQIIHPYMFGDPFSKPTCFWVENGFPLIETYPKELWADKGEFMVCRNGKRGAKWNWGLSPSDDRAKIRSKTFQGVAEGIANALEKWIR
jgi:hypothetical protein